MTAEPTLLRTVTDVAQLCAEIRQAGVFALDTEFVSERTYVPELALVQIATPQRVALVDAIAVPDLGELWRLVAGPEVTTVVHAYEQEARFCWEAVDVMPAALVDVQLAAGFTGLRYPMAYGTLVRSVLGRRLQQSETRTDWTRRPLSARQIGYARDDVAYLLPLHEKLRDRLGDGRGRWLDDEMANRLRALAADLTSPQWRRVPGSQRLGRRSLAALRELFRWREAEARARNLPRRRVLRDDLLLALAETLPETAEALTRVRGLERQRRDDRAALLECIAIARGLQEDQLPARAPGWQAPSQARMLALFLEAVMESACVRAGVDATLVGAASDLREVIRWHLGDRDRGAPALFSGWREKVCGEILRAALQGTVLLRVDDPAREHPLSVVWPEGAPSQPPEPPAER